MTTPYYQDDTVTLYCGDSLEVLPALDVTADVLLTDPPYFKVKQDEWDNQWQKAGEFLRWMGEWLDRAKPLLAPHASVWVFASPAMTSSVERLIGEKFRVLNSIRWVKPEGAHLRGSLSDLRRFRTPWEGCILAEQQEDAWAAIDYQSHKDAFNTAGAYLKQQRTKAGLTRADLSAVLVERGAYASLQSANANMSLQEIGQRRIPAEVYTIWSEFVPLKPYAEMVADYESALEDRLRRRTEYEAKRRAFNIADIGFSTDVWDFAPVNYHKGKHPCEKPQPMLRRMIEVSTRPGATILDPFAGSGSTILAARSLGRKTVAIEKDEAWCEKIAQRLSENTLNLGEAA